MSNRTLVKLTAIMLFAIIILIAYNLTDLLMGQSPNQDFLKYNNVRGMAISHDKKLYTLSFKQQNTIVDIINQAVPLNDIASPQPLPLVFDQLIIYQFNDKPDIILTPIASSEKNIVFSAPVFVPGGNHYFMELSEGDLTSLLSQTYD